MKPFCCVISSLAILLQVNLPAVGSELAGNELYSDCSSDNKFIKFSCGRFIFGIVQGIRIGVVIAGKNGDCFPDNVTQSQLILIVQKYLKEHPEDLHQPAGALVALATINVFPCPKP